MISRYFLPNFILLLKVHHIIGVKQCTKSNKWHPSSRLTKSPFYQVKIYDSDSLSSNINNNQLQLQLTSQKLFNLYENISQKFHSLHILIPRGVWVFEISSSLSNGLTRRVSFFPGRDGFDWNCGKDILLI